MNKSWGVVVILCVAFASSTALAQARPARSVYRFDVSISGLEEGAHAAPVTCTLILEENGNGSSSTGANVPLQTTAAGGAASPRQDVGLSIHFTYTLRGTVVVLEGGVELSSVEPTTVAGAPVSIRRVRAEGVAPLTAGTPALFASLYDVTSHRHYEVTITAQRLL